MYKEEGSSGDAHQRGKLGGSLPCKRAQGRGAVTFIEVSSQRGERERKGAKGRTRKRTDRETARCKEGNRLNLPASSFAIIQKARDSTKEGRRKADHAQLNGEEDVNEVGEWLCCAANRYSREGRKTLAVAPRGGPRWSDETEAQLQSKGKVTLETGAKEEQSESRKA